MKMERLNAKVINALICLHTEIGPVHMLGELLEKHSFDAVHLENMHSSSFTVTVIYKSLMLSLLINKCFISLLIVSYL